MLWRTWGFNKYISIYILIFLQFTILLSITYKWPILNHLLFSFYQIYLLLLTYSVIFTQLCSTQINSVDAATILRTCLFNSIRFIIKTEDDIKDPHELARIVEEAIIWGPCVTMVTTDNLIDLLVNKPPTPVEALNTLKLWRTYEPRNKNGTYLWCKICHVFPLEEIRWRI